jgi:hypothetical protein
MDIGGGTMTRPAPLIVRTRARNISAAACLTTLTAMLVAGQAHGEPGATEKATAEALFQQGTEMMNEKQYATACDKFAGSHQLDPALGTLLRLADCQDRVGKSASAWATFKEAASMARSRNEPDRQRIADERALELEKRLSKLEIKIDTKSLPVGFDLKLNNVSIPRATWDATIPVDPGRQKLEASAPGRVTWTGGIEVPDGPAMRSIEIPALAVKTEASNSTISTSAGSTRDAVSSPGSTQRTFGFVASGLGLVGLGVGAFFGYQAYSQNQDSLVQCRVDDPNACTPDGKTMRDDARGTAMGSTIALAAGGALTVGGLILVLTAKSEPRHAGSDLRLTTGLVGRGPGIQLEGKW